MSVDVIETDRATFDWKKLHTNYITRATRTICPFMSKDGVYINCIADKCQMWDYGDGQCSFKRKKLFAPE